MAPQSFVRVSPKTVADTIEDGQMRHGRKSRSKRFDGYKRHVLKDLDSGERPSSGNYPRQCSRSFCHRSDRRRPRKTESGA